MTQRPPLGVMPFMLWWDSVGCDPTLAELRQRFDEVSAALERYRLAGLWQPAAWLDEVGVRCTRCE